ncbi:MAG: hypothetical protein LBN33_03965, partial [Desulfovibrio sp.]|nr:hypothetical protein [Desulfovibrio sp.]
DTEARKKLFRSGFCVRVYTDIQIRCFRHTFYLSKKTWHNVCALSLHLLIVPLPSLPVTWSKKYLH